MRIAVRLPERDRVRRDGDQEESTHAEECDGRAATQKLVVDDGVHPIAARGLRSTGSSVAIGRWKSTLSSLTGS